MRDLLYFVLGIVVTLTMLFGAAQSAGYQHPCASDEFVREDGVCQHIDSIRSKRLSPAQIEAVHEIIDERLHCITNPNDCG